MANKTIYDDMITPVLLLWMSRSGLTNIEIANEIGCAEKTLYTWQKKHEKVKAALRAGRDYFDATVENALYKSATGFKTRSVVEKVERNVTPGPDFGELVVVERTTVITDHAPNVTAIIWWQKNRRPGEWRDKHEIDLTGNITIKPPSSPEEFFPACPDCNGSGHVTHLEDGKETEIECSRCRGDGYVDPV